MSKYIDADKLIAEIERLKELHKGLLSGKFRSGYNSAFQQVLSFIASLQQEQPADGDDGKFVKISVRKEVAEQFQKLGDVILAGQSSFIRAMNQQKQPEADLEKELKEYFSGWADSPDYGQALNSDGECVSTDEVIALARHFAEWGAIYLNARKEE